MALRIMPLRSSVVATLRITTVPRLVTRRSYANATKPTNPTTQFYKTFTRPVAKVLILAVFTYQVAYWSWNKLEADELCEKTDGTIASLEATVNDYRITKESQNKS